MECLRCFVIDNVLGVVSGNGKFTLFDIVNVLGVVSGNVRFTLYCYC